MTTITAGWNQFVWLDLYSEKDEKILLHALYTSFLNPPWVVQRLKQTASTTLPLSANE